MKIKIYKKRSAVSLLLISAFFLPLYPAVFTAYSPDGAAESVFTAWAQGGDTGERTASVSAGKERTLGFVTNILGKDESVSLDPKQGAEVLRNVLNTIIRVIFSFAGIILVIMLSVYGTQLIYAQMLGRVGDIVVKKSKIIDIAIGAGILLLSYLILNFINPQLLSPSLLGLGASPPEREGRVIPSLTVRTCTLFGDNVVRGELYDMITHPADGKKIIVKEKDITVFFWDAGAVDGGKTQSKVFKKSEGSTFSHMVDGVSDSAQYRVVIVRPSVSINGENYVGGYTRCKTDRKDSNTPPPPARPTGERESEQTQTAS